MKTRIKVIEVEGEETIYKVQTKGYVEFWHDWSWGERINFMLIPVIGQMFALIEIPMVFISHLGWDTYSTYKTEKQAKSVIDSIRTSVENAKNPKPKKRISFIKYP